MTENLIYIDESSEIPLFGVDFLGIIDRGTNVIELKPLTLCNLKCRYCFVSAGDYDTNFIVDINYLLKKVRDVINLKGKSNIEIHIAPYGETLLHPNIFDLIENLWKIEGISIISLQSNGLLLSEEVIKKLEKAKLTRINISLNTLNKDLAEYFCNCKNYDIVNLKQNIELLLKSPIDVLIAPVWFPGENDKDIEDIIKYVIDLRKQGYSEKKIQIGIQKYLIYKTGRRLKKIRPKTWGYFYKKLSEFEKKYSIKLKLGPNDFGIHKRANISTFFLQKGHLIDITVISKGRWNGEAIGKINDDFGIKLLINKPMTFSLSMVGKRYKTKVIKANYKDNIITAILLGN